MPKTFTTTPVLVAGTLLAAIFLLEANPSAVTGSYQRVCDICIGVNISDGSDSYKTVGRRGACRRTDLAAKRDARQHWSSNHAHSTVPLFQGDPSRVMVFQFLDADCREDGEPIWSVDEDCQRCERER